MSTHMTASARWETASADGNTFARKVASQDKDGIAQPSPHTICPVKTNCYLVTKEIWPTSENWLPAGVCQMLVLSTSLYMWVHQNGMMHVIVKTVYARVGLGNKEHKNIFVAKEISLSEEVGGRCCSEG